MRTGNQNGGREYDDLQNLFDMTSHEKKPKWGYAPKSRRGQPGLGMHFGTG